MTIRVLASVVLIALAAAPVAHASPPSELCKRLRVFTASVPSGETRELTFRTSWGSGFKDAAEPAAMSARRCEHAGHAPAESVCAHLMQQGSVEFPGTTVKESIACLARGTTFDPGLSLDRGAFSFRYGSAHRSARIDIDFDADAEIGGMAFRLAVAGD